MKKIKSLLTASIVIATTAYSFGQAAFVPDTLRRDSLIIKKYEIGVDIKPLFNGSGAGFLYKRNYRNGRCAFRLRVDGNFHNTMTTQQDSITGTSITYGVTVAPGFEKVIRYRRMGFVMGSDLPIGISGTMSSTGHNNSNMDTRNTTYNFNVGLAPFLGFDYALFNNFSIRLEVSSYLGYTKGDTKNEQKTNNSADYNYVTNHHTTDSFNFSLINSVRLYLTYRF